MLTIEGSALRKFKVYAISIALFFLVLAMIFLTPSIMAVYKKHFKDSAGSDEDFAIVIRAIDHMAEKKFNTAFSELEPIAETKNRTAMYYLAYLYMTGQGVSQNYSEAMRLYNESAEMGDGQSQVMLSKIYAEGVVAERNPKKAYAWAAIAYSSDSTLSPTKAEAKTNMGLIAGELSRADLLRAQAEAASWKEKN